MRQVPIAVSLFCYSVWPLVIALSFTFCRHSSLVTRHCISARRFPIEDGFAHAGHGLLGDFFRTARTVFENFPHRLRIRSVRRAALLNRRNPLDERVGHLRFTIEAAPHS